MPKRTQLYALPDYEEEPGGLPTHEIVKEMTATLKNEVKSEVRKALAGCKMEQSALAHKVAHIINHKKKAIGERRVNGRVVKAILAEMSAAGEFKEGYGSPGPSPDPEPT